MLRRSCGLIYGLVRVVNPSRKLGISRIENMLYGKIDLLNFNFNKYILVKLKFGDDFDFLIEWRFPPLDLCEYKPSLQWYVGLKNNSIC